MALDLTRAAAESVLSLVLTDTEKARDLAAGLLAQDQLPADARAVALFALGRAHVELGEPGRAIPFLEDADDLAASINDTELRALVASRLAVALFENGRARDAMERLDRAAASENARARGTALNARGILLLHQGQLRASKDAFDEAVLLLDSAGDTDMLVRSLASRSATAARLGQLEAAEADLQRSTGLAESLGMAAVVAGNLHNLGFVRSQAGMVPEALEAYGQARDAYAAAGAPARAMAILDTDNAETLLLAGLHDEALQAAERTVAEAMAAGHVVQQAESHLLLARILFAAERIDECIEAAGTASRLFAESDRVVWAGQARSLGIQAVDSSRRDVGEMRTIISELEAQGWVAEVKNLLTLLSRSLVEQGDLDAARAALDRAEKGRRAPAIVRSSMWHARALIRVADGDRSGALRALRTGLDLLNEHRSALGATELRVSAARRATKICELGLELSLEAGRRANALRWIERGRAQALRLPPARPPGDEALARDLAELRRLDAEARDTELGAGELASVQAATAAVERRVRDHARSARGGHQKRSGDVVVADIRSRLGSRTLVEFFESDRRLRAAVVDRAGVEIVDLADVAPVESALDALMFALRRLAAGRVSSATFSAVHGGLVSSASDLGSLVGAALPPTGDVVIVPSETLQATPWQLLPVLSGRVVTTAPSAFVWMRHHPRPDGSARVRVLAGPGLPAAVDEVRSVEAMYDDAAALTGEDATVEAGLAAAGEADLLHLAAHGTFRADSPMFSSLLLSDGPLTVYDIEGLRSVPETVVLSACHAAAREASVGDEVMGTAMALVAMGVRSVVAPLVAIADEATKTVMVAFHRRLAAGATPEQALAEVTAEWVDSDPMLAATAAAFVVIGSDSRG